MTKHERALWEIATGQFPSGYPRGREGCEMYRKIARDALGEKWTAFTVHKEAAKRRGALKVVTVDGGAE
jgi:hypothetical protein